MRANKPLSLLNYTSQLVCFEFSLNVDLNIDEVHLMSSTSARVVSAITVLHFDITLVYNAIVLLMQISSNISNQI